MNRKIYSIFAQFQKRSEQLDLKISRDTFVDDDQDYLKSTLLSLDSQIIYGRRGTGKTHALRYIQQNNEDDRDIPIYIDMRTLSSNQNLYQSNDIDVVDRATGFIADILEIIHDVINGLSEKGEISVEDIDIRNLSEAIANIQYKHIIETDKTVENENRSLSSKNKGLNGGISNLDLGLKGEIRENSDSENKIKTTVKQTYAYRKRLAFNELNKSFKLIQDSLGSKRIWLLLDEWVIIPPEVQPYVADLIRRVFLPLTKVTVKITAIEHRSNFQKQESESEYVGFELGADIAAVLDMDDFMVFGNSQEKALNFFQKLIFRHYESAIASTKIGKRVFEKDKNFKRIGFFRKIYYNFKHNITPRGIKIPHDMPKSSNELVARIFESNDVFIEFVRSTEGVPRDGINILLLAAQESVGKPISQRSISIASTKWNARDKESTLASYKSAERLFHYIINRVSEMNGQRSFCIESKKEHYLIERLFDLRVIHIKNERYFVKNFPGNRYTRYVIDYGSFLNIYGGESTKVPRFNKERFVPIIITNSEIETVILGNQATTLEQA